MTEWYWCDTCQDVKQAEYDVVPIRRRDRMGVFVCGKCGSEVEPHETYDCPIHGTAAPDGAGNCAKC